MIENIYYKNREGCLEYDEIDGDINMLYIYSGNNVHLYRSLLHQACHFGLYDFAKRLIELGADVNIQNNKGNTPLHEAADKLELAKLLIRHGALINSQNICGRTPLMKSSVDVMKLLLRRGANKNLQDINGYTAAMLLRRVELIDKLDIQDNDGWTLMMHAAKHDDVVLVEALLERSADLYIVNLAGENIIDIALRHKSYEVCAVIGRFF